MVNLSFQTQIDNDKGNNKKLRISNLSNIDSEKFDKIIQQQ